MMISQEHLNRQFQAVFNAYYNSLCNYAFHYVKNADTSEDLVQETFLKIWQDRRELILSDTIRYYLFTAVRNNSITYLRQEKNTGLLPWGGQDISAEPVRRGEVESQEEYEWLLNKAIDRLPPKCREVFLLSRIGKLTYKQIAVNLDISVKTVENQMSKALKMMRQFLKEKGIYMAFLIAGFFS
ncbi:RNA polymerase sigma-70 factor [Flavitalea flava]